MCLPEWTRDRIPVRKAYVHGERNRNRGEDQKADNPDRGKSVAPEHLLPAIAQPSSGRSCFRLLSHGPSLLRGTGQRGIYVVGGVGASPSNVRDGGRGSC